VNPPRQGQVHRVAEGAGIADAAAFEGIGVGGIHVQRQRRHQRVANEGRLDAVAVVGVEIDIQHPQPLPTQPGDGQHRIVDVAETACAIGTGVVHPPRRAEGDTARQQHLRAQDAPVGRRRGGREEAGKEGVLEIADVMPLPVAVRDLAIGLALAQRPDVFARVEPLEFDRRRRPRHAELLRGQRSVGADQVQRQRDARDPKRVVAAIGMPAVTRGADEHRSVYRRNRPGFNINGTRCHDHPGTSIRRESSHDSARDAPHPPAPGSDQRKALIVNE